MGTHLNCIDKSMQFKWVPTIFAFKKYTGCNLKTTVLLDCVLIRVCAVIRSNTVSKYYQGLTTSKILLLVHHFEYSMRVYDVIKP